MKIRSDYVSNSSSSSFVLVLPKDADLKKFIKDIVRSCSRKPEYDISKEDKKELDDFNRINLEYCLRTYELLFLGEIEEKTSDDYEAYLTGITTTRSTMEYRMMRSPYRKKDEKGDRKRRADAIMEYARDEERSLSSTRSGIYEITLNTIMNTEDLIAEGHKVVLDDWESRLMGDEMKDRLSKGDRVFAVQMNQAGDGRTDTSVYALSGWDSDINHYANAEVLDCEPG